MSTPDEKRRVRYYALPKRKGRLLPFLGFTLWTLVAVLAAIGFGAWTFLDTTLSQASPNTPTVKAAIKTADPVKPGEPVNVLLIGSDQRPDEEGIPGRSDSLILMRMDARNNFISLLSFPRDLWVNIPGSGQAKLNAAYTLGGPATAIATIRELTGQPVNHYVDIDFEGFRRLVDEVGGVYLDVDRRYFNDNSGRAPGATFAEIDIEPGFQRLDGDNALDYVRYRHTDSDFARIRRQQQFLSDLKRQTNQADNLLNLRALGDIFGDSIETSIRSVPQMLDLVRLSLTVDEDRVGRVSVEGFDDFRGEQAVVVAGEGAIAKAVDEWLEPDFQSTETAKPAATSVAVLNGSGRIRSADRTSALLREKGWDAEDGGNAENFGYANSEVRYVPGQRPAAVRLQRLMGDGTELVGLSATAATALGSDLQLVVGADFPGQLSKPPPAPDRRPAPAAVSTAALVPVLRQIQRANGPKVMAPLKVARGSRVRRVRAYKAAVGGKKVPAVTIVFETGTQKYWGMSIVGSENLSVLEGETGKLERGGRTYFTYYDGRNMQRLAWRKDGVSYWVSNSLDYALSDETMWAIAKSARPLNRAKLSKGTADVGLEIEREASTP